jgi:EAL domain-containing protein (putative c-di-GMP-specific phosphodiesterase class I)
VRARAFRSGRRGGRSHLRSGGETPEQVATLREVHADRAEGYLFARPQTEDDMARWAEITDRDAGPYAETRSSNG